jgi:hypothetical protein
MPEDEQRGTYQAVIDAMVDECRHGQGQVLPGWVRRGVWSQHALDHPGEMPAEQVMNNVLADLDDEQRDVIATMLVLAYEGAMHDALHVLHDHEVPPFDDGYEGAAFNDFMGRLRTDWAWPA